MFSDEDIQTRDRRVVHLCNIAKVDLSDEDGDKHQGESENNIYKMISPLLLFGPSLQVKTGIRGEYCWQC
jgi:hypothetical protein